jgi:hypothetical protein
MSPEQVPTTPNATRAKRLVVVTLRLALAVCAVGYIAYIVERDLPRLARYVLPFSVERAAWLALCTLLLGLGPFFSVAVFRLLAQRYRVNLPYRACLRLLLMTNVMRYLPGRFLGVAYQVGAPLSGLNGGQMLRLNLEQLVTSLLGNTFAAFGVLMVGSGRTVLGAASIAASLPAMAFVLRWRLPRRLRGWLAARGPASYRALLKDEVSPHAAGARWSIAALNLLSLLPYLLAWHWLDRVFPLLTGQPLIELAASYVVAWAAGVLVFVTPGGLGVREAIFLIVSPPVARDAVAWLAIFARVWHLFADLVAWLLGALVPSLLSHKSRPGSSAPSIVKPS